MTFIYPNKRLCLCGKVVLIKNYVKQITNPNHIEKLRNAEK